MTEKYWLVRGRSGHFFNLFLCLPIFLSFWTLSRIILRVPEPFWSGVLALAVILITFKNPLWAYRIFISASIFILVLPWPNCSEIIFLALGGTWLIRLIIKREYSLVRTPQILPLLLLGLLILVSFFVSGDFFMTRQSLLTKEYLYVIFGYLITLNLHDTREKTINTVRVLLAGALVVSLYGIFQYFTGFDLIPYFQPARGQAVRRVQSLMENPNYLGGYLAIFIPLIILLGIRAKNFDRVKHFLGGAIILLAFIFSFSFSSFLALLAGCLIFFTVFNGEFSKIKPAKKFVLKCLLGILLIFLAVWLLWGPTLIKLVLIKGEHFASRYTNVWPFAINTIIRRPFRGTGFGQHAIIFENYKLLVEGRAHLHNAYLQLTVELGLVGLAILLWFLIGGFWFSRKPGPDRELTIIQMGLWAGLLSLVIFFLGDNMFNFFWFWIISGLLAAAARLNCSGQDSPPAAPSRVILEKIFFYVFLILILGRFLPVGANILPDNFEKRFEVYKITTNLTDRGWYAPILRDKKDLARLPDNCWMANYGLIEWNNRSHRPQPAVLHGQVLSFMRPRTLQIFVGGRLVWQEKITGTTRNGRYKKFSVNLRLAPGANRVKFFCPEGVDSPAFLAIEKDFRWISFNFKKDLTLDIAGGPEKLTPVAEILKQSIVRLNPGSAE